jgi:prepilin-type processing-associated H-X9-DG protein
LLIVISILVLLMAILLPTLSRVRKQAKAVVCQSRLRELGLLSAIYIREHMDRGLQLCPSAPTPLPGPPVPWGDAFHAFAMGRGVASLAPPEKRRVGGYASYGWNGRSDYGYDEPHPRKERWWLTHDIKGAWRVPVLFDCAMYTAGLDHLDPPPEQPFTPPPNPATSSEYRVSPVCIQRHGEGINMLFLDWSVRKVGPKELWTLKWHRQFNTSGGWTKAGGVQAEDWPEWMRGFKDY